MIFLLWLLWNTPPQYYNLFNLNVSSNNTILFLFMAEKYSIVYMYHIFFIHSSVDGHLGCFYVLSVVNSASVNIGVHVSFQIMVFSGYTPRTGIARSYSGPIFRFEGTSVLFRADFFTILCGIYGQWCY